MDRPAQKSCTAFIKGSGGPKFRAGYERPIEDPKDIEKALEGAIAAKRRGAPACIGENTILDVTARRGTLEAVYLSEDRELAAFFKESGVTVQKGQVIAEAARLDALLAAIGRYYQKREKGKECRFDYRLMYLTGDDYRLAREKIERYLYHSGRPLQIRG